LGRTRATGVAGLLIGALVWGILWYPYRVLEGWGVPGTIATLASYAAGLAGAICISRRELDALVRPEPMLVLIALSAGWANLAYVLGTLKGQVMQVLLLFYLAPLWTVLFARVLLNERPGYLGMLVILLSLAGAALMLWQPGVRFPWPHTAAEWFGLSSGMSFALSNVLIRKAHHHSIRVKSTAVCAGVVLIALLVVLLDGDCCTDALKAGWIAAGLLIAIGLVALAANLAVQHGLSVVSANQAIVILLSELVVAAVASYFLAGEVMRWNQWAGGVIIMLATLLSGRLSRQP
jgi:drug/metabolite transporter (DMT)-like permease